MLSRIRIVLCNALAVLCGAGLAYLAAISNGDEPYGATVGIKILAVAISFIFVATWLLTLGDLRERMGGLQRRDGKRSVEQAVSRFYWQMQMHVQSPTIVVLGISHAFIGLIVFNVNMLEIYIIAVIVSLAAQVGSYFFTRILERHLIKKAYFRMRSALAVG